MMVAAGPPPSSSHHSDPRPSIRSRSSVSSPHTPGRRPPRSLPPWIDSYEARYGTPTDEQFRAIHSPPPRAVPPQHNHAPSEPTRRVSRDGFVYADRPAFPPAENASSRARLRKLLRRRDGSERGRKWDHLRSAEPVIVPRFHQQTPWRSYIQSSRYGHLPGEDAEVVGTDVLEKLQPNFNNPVDTPLHRDPTRGRDRRTKVLYKRLWEIILRHPLVPLAFRLIVLLTSIVALALSARIFRIENEELGTNTSERTQSIVAIVVDTVAIPYIGYMTWDEYTGKPLGLRPATAKISLVLMDLFFIIFKSASTTLAFEALVYHNAQDRQIRQYSQALAAFQTVGLISWSFTFTVNVFRLVQRLGGGEDERRNG